MSKLSIKRLSAAVTLGLLLVVPAPVLAAINPDPQSAAEAGIQYLANNQQADGGISGFGGESEWTVEAVQADGQQASTFAHGGSSLLDFLETDVPPAGSSTTTLERNIIAIAAAGQDPANFGGVNYEALLEAQHQSGQIGDPTLLNDDIFGIIAIDAAHDTSLVSEAQDGLNYMLAHQGADGGFSYTTDSSVGSDNNDTAAAIIAMYAASDLGLTNSNLDTAKSSALAYLLSTQQPDGGFSYDQFSPSDGDSTAWSLMALNTIGSSVTSQATEATDWLLNNQNTDGGFSYAAYGTTTSDTYTTANVVIALLGTTWLLRPTPLSTAGQTTQSSGGSGGGSTSPAATQPTTPATTAATTTEGPTSITTTTISDSSPPAAQTADTMDATPQVKGASTKKVSPKTSNQATKPNRAYSIYAAILLVLAALTWFVVESRKTKGVGHAS